MNDLEPQAVALYGEARPPRRPVNAQAGPVRFVFEDGMIKHVRWGDVELVRRIYFAVRDDAWDTIYPTFENVKIESSGGTFRATFDAECRNEVVHYRWRGHIESNSDGTIIFRASGAPECDFSSNRIGLCLLLSADALAGQPFELTKDSGEKEKGRFSRYIDHNLVGARFQAIRFLLPRGPGIECAMEGAIFDMEDQRLYMETTYKAYAPLPHDYPRARAGESLVQTLTMRWIEAPPTVRASATDEPVQGPVVITVDPQTVGHAPKLGLTLNALEGEAALTDTERADLAAVKPGHLRIAIDLDDEATSAHRLGAAATIIADITDTALVSVHHLTEFNVAALVDGCRPLLQSGLRRLMVEACDASVDVLPVVRLAFSQEKIDVQVGGPGSEDVSSHPHLRSWALAEPDFLCWAGSSAIHQEDDETLMENTLGIAMQLESARQMNDQVRLGMGPFRLDGPWPRPHPTPRRTARFAAAWLATAVKHLGEGGAAFATLFDATGPTGLFYRRAAFDQPAFDEGETRPYPAGLMTAWLAAQRGRPLLTSSSSAPLRVQAMALVERTASDPTLLLINQTFRPQAVRVESLKGKARVHHFANEHPRMSTQLPALAAGEYPAHSDRVEPLVIAPYSVIWLRPADLESS